MRILIINSPLFRENNELYDEDSLPPIGLALIATNLRNNGHCVELVDSVADKLTIEQIKTKILIFDPDFLCINIFSTNYLIVKDLLESLECRTNIVIGGLSTLDLYEKIFCWKTQNKIDVIHGDGEFIINDLVTNKLRENPRFAIEKRRFFVVDKESSYFANDISNELLDRSFFKNEPTKHIFGFTEANIITSRGCIYNCSFCAAASSLNKQFSIREKSEESIIKEVLHLKALYPGLQSIRVLDDLFLKNQGTIEKAINVFSTFGLKWRTMAHVQTFKGVDLKTLEKLKHSGCTELFIGIESGSPKILKQIHKTSDIDLIKLNLTNLFRVGISVKAYFIFGFPSENEEDFKMTYDLASYLKEESVKHGVQFRTSVFQFRPYHGTELYHKIISDKEQVDKLVTTEPNEKLSELVGRIQFNFHSGNLSDEDINTVHKYIYLTSNLTPLKIYENNYPNEIDKRNSIMSKL
ncbi:MAG: radical SAM protein [Ignavibacteria bacterium]|nr:radical SAM protein [Ignavibacteria bacterium]